MATYSSILAWGCKELDTTEQLTHTYKILCSIAAPPTPHSFGTYNRTNLDTAQIGMLVLGDKHLISHELNGRK